MTSLIGFIFGFLIGFFHDKIRVLIAAVLAYFKKK